MQKFDRGAFILANKNKSTEELREMFAVANASPDDPEQADRAFLIMSEVTSRGEGVYPPPSTPAPLT